MVSSSLVSSLTSLLNHKVVDSSQNSQHISRYGQTSHRPLSSAASSHPPSFQYSSRMGVHYGIHRQKLGAIIQRMEALVGGPLVQAWNFAAITGVNVGIACIMKWIRGKDVLESTVVAALGSGFTYSLVSSRLQGQHANAITTATDFTLFQGVFFKVL